MTDEQGSINEHFSHIRFKNEPEISSPSESIETDPKLEEQEREALIEMFRSYGKPHTIHNYAKDRSLRGKARKRARRKNGSV